MAEMANGKLVLTDLAVTALLFRTVVRHACRYVLRLARPEAVMADPLFDTVGAGLSFLDDVLHAVRWPCSFTTVTLSQTPLPYVSLQRVNPQGVVEKTLTRLLYVGLLTQPPQAVFDLHAGLSSSADTTGLLVALPSSFLGLVESPSEDVVSLLRHLEGAVTQGSAGISSLRVVACIEDSPSRYFGPFSCRSVVTPAEAPPNLEEGTIGLATDMMAAVTGVGQQLLELSSHSGDLAAALEQLQEPRVASQLPSDERVKAVAGSDQVRECNGTNGRAWPVHFRLALSCSSRQSQSGSPSTRSPCFSTRLQKKCTPFLRGSQCSG